MTVVQMPKYPCPFCKKNESTQLCDFVVDYGSTIFCSPRNGGIIPAHPETCDNQICKECAIQYNSHEFCPSCNELHKYIKKNHDKRLGRMMVDIALGNYEEHSLNLLPSGPRPDRNT